MIISYTRHPPCAALRRPFLHALQGVVVEGLLARDVLVLQVRQWLRGSDLAEKHQLFFFFTSA